MSCGSAKEKIRRTGQCKGRMGKKSVLVSLTGVTAGAAACPSALTLASVWEVRRKEVKRKGPLPQYAR